MKNNRQGIRFPRSTELSGSRQVQGYQSSSRPIIIDLSAVALSLPNGAKAEADVSDVARSAKTEARETDKALKGILEFRRLCVR